MSRRGKSTSISLTPGWAIYLRTSNKDAQNPEMSQSRQRHAIDRTLLEKSELRIIGEYIDNESGRYANREGYQRLLFDAREGKFSHVAVENAERFGRNDAEALTIIDELDGLGIAIRFADYSELDPVDPDDRILISLSFTLARRESIKLGQRTSGGLLAKMRNGGFATYAPDGYMNVEERTDPNSKLLYGRYTRWISQDPERAKIWRQAWDLLLEDKYTLAQICEQLHELGYTYRSGRAFVEFRRNGKRKVNKNTLSSIFHNWVYAGWVVSETHNIPPKTIRGDWEPIVTTEEFEKGLAILARRCEKRIPRRKHNYLLSGLIYFQLLDSNKLKRLTCSTSNPKRGGGGTSHYRLEGYNINLLCRDIDNQMITEIKNIQINPDHLPLIRTHYSDEVQEKLGHKHTKKHEEIETTLKLIDEEEKRAARLYAAGKITDHVWDMLWQEWQDRRLTLRSTLESAKQKSEFHIAHLDDALTIISQIGVLYESMELEDQRRLLREVVDKVVVDESGKIIRIELLPPFAYLDTVSRQIGEVGSNIPEKTKTSNKTGPCSSQVLLGDPGRTRTSNLTIKSRLLCH